MQRQSTKITITCPRCKKPFEVFPHELNRRKFCSRECYWPPVTTTCRNCGKHFLATPSRIRTGWAKHCSWECRQATMRKTAKDRFWTRVRKTSKCWLWCGYKGPHGYGEAYWNGKRAVAHRVAWLITKGEIPEGLLVLHGCDNRICVRPSHLFLGTQADNIADMIRKGRHAHGETHPWKLKPSLIPRGESHYAAKFTEHDIREMRKLREQGRLLREIAQEYGTTVRAVSDIVLRKIWKHI